MAEAERGEEKKFSLRKDATELAKKQVHDRTNFHCQKCGEKCLDGQLAHIVSVGDGLKTVRPYRNYPDLMTKSEKELSELLSSEENFLWLCHSCHVTVDGNTRHYTREALMEMRLRVPKAKVRTEDEKMIHRRVLDEVFTMTCSEIIRSEFIKETTRKGIDFLLDDDKLCYSDWIPRCLALLGYVREKDSSLLHPDMVWNVTQKVCRKISWFVQDGEGIEGKTLTESSGTGEKKQKEAKLEGNASELLRKLCYITHERRDRDSPLLSKSLIIILALMNEEELPEVMSMIEESDFFMAKEVLMAGKYLRTHDDLFPFEKTLSGDGCFKLGIGKFPTFRNKG